MFLVVQYRSTVYEYTQITIRNNPDLLYGERLCPPGPVAEWRAAGPAATPPATDGQSAWRSRDQSPVILFGCHVICTQLSRDMRPTVICWARLSRDLRTAVTWSAPSCYMRSALSCHVICARLSRDLILFNNYRTYIWYGTHWRTLIGHVTVH